MNIKQLEYLRTVRNEGSFAQAAQRMGVSPQAVAKALRLFEAELGAPLFVQEGRSVRPTEVCEQIIPLAAETLRRFADLTYFVQGLAKDGEGFAAEEAVDAAGNAESSGPTPAGALASEFAPRVVKLGVSQNAPLPLDEADFARYQERHPHSPLVVHALCNEHCLCALASGVLDAALVQGRADGPLFQNHLVRNSAVPLYFACKKSRATELAPLYRYVIAATQRKEPPEPLPTHADRRPGKPLTCL